MKREDVQQRIDELKKQYLEVTAPEDLTSKGPDELREMQRDLAEDRKVVFQYQYSDYAPRIQTTATALLAALERQARVIEGEFSRRESMSARHESRWMGGIGNLLSMMALIIAILTYLEVKTCAAPSATMPFVTHPDGGGARELGSESGVIASPFRPAPVADGGTEDFHHQRVENGG